MSDMKYYTWYSMHSLACRHEQMFGVYIAGDQFDMDAGRWDLFIGRVKSKFPEKQALNISSSVLNRELILFKSETEAWALFAVMTGSEFYSKEYAVIYNNMGDVLMENT